jgi:hypothetical protein
MESSRNILFPVDAGESRRSGSWTAPSFPFPPNHSWDTSCHPLPASFPPSSDTEASLLFDEPTDIGSSSTCTYTRPDDDRFKYTCCMWTRVLCSSLRFISASVSDQMLRRSGHGGPVGLVNRTRAGILSVAVLQNKDILSRPRVGVASVCHLARSVLVHVFLGYPSPLIQELGLILTISLRLSRASRILRPFHTLSLANSFLTHDCHGERNYPRRRLHDLHCGLSF